MYKSPIEIMQEHMRCKMDDDIYTAVLNYGINVDKEELLRALKYDRLQYDNGYRDGIRDANAELVRCENCIHHDKGWCNLHDTIMNRNDFCSCGERREENG